MSSLCVSRLVAAEFYDLQRSLLHGTYTAVGVAMVVCLLALLVSTRLVLSRIVKSDHTTIRILLFYQIFE